MPYKLLLRLRVTRDCAWERRYHRKIRGWFSQALRETEYDGVRDTQAAPFAFSDPMPYSNELKAGDELHLVVAASDIGVLETIAASLRENPEVTAGAFVLEARAAIPIEIDVGAPGTEGTVTTSSGIVLTVNQRHESDTATPDYWTDREHDVATFREAFHRAALRLYEHETELEPPDAELFDDYRHRKTYAVDVEVTPKNDLTVIASKWDFGYTVRDDRHRERLNALLALGIGSKRSYGFGMLQTRDAAEATATTEATAHG